MKQLTFTRWRLALLASLVVASGCATTKNSQDLSFLKDGTTARSEVFLKLGTPSTELIESKTFSFIEKLTSGGSRKFGPAQTLVTDQLYVYHLQSDSKGNFRLVSVTVNDADGGTQWPRHDDLVLEFNPATGILKRHSLVTVTR